MLRILNIVAIVTLMGSAVYAYTIKYQTAYRAEQIARTKYEIKQERDAIAVLRAEWAFMTRPERMQQLADAHLPNMKQLDVTQIVSAQQLPDKAPRVDSIGQKLDALLGLNETPPSAPSATMTTPKASATPKTGATPKAAPKTQPHKPTTTQASSNGQKKL